MERKIDEIINFEKIILLILNEDIHKVIDVMETTDFKPTKEFIQTLRQLANTNDLDEAILIMDKLLQLLIKTHQSNLSVIMMQFKTRYVFYQMLNIDYLNYVKEFQLTLLEGDLDFIFKNIFGPLFKYELNFYLTDYLEFIKQMPIEPWNVKLNEDLKKLVGQSLEPSIFKDKLSRVEQLINYLKNLGNLYTDFNKNENQMDFASETNVLETNLISAHILIERVMSTLKVANQGLN